MKRLNEEYIVIIFQTVMVPKNFIFTDQIEINRIGLTDIDA